jgi:two-component system, cell cycle response regulator
MGMPLARNSSPATDSVKILIADDSAVSRKLLEHTLTEQKYVLIFAKSGHEAIQLFETHHPALAIVDWVMPDLTGIEICQHIRANAQTAYTYTIFLTQMAEKENVVEGLAAGADDYLTKPFHTQELIARIRTGVRIVELQRQIEAKNVLLEQLALTDALTGLPNRRAIDDWATRQVSAAARHKFSFWIIVSDLDHFKHTNDTHGHDAGDQVLKRFAEILKTNSRRSDICGRLGGEEFLMIITHAKKENVLVLMDRIRKEFEETRFVFRGRPLRVTASFGIAGFEGKETPDFPSLLAQADAALYLAKRQGRNRIEMASTMRPDPKVPV